MPTYSIAAINVGTFNLGESDRLLTVFSAERGLLKVVAKGARKPGSKMTGRAELLHVNKLLLATGRSLDIITQAESIEAYPRLRKDLVCLAYGLYYAELTQAFGPGLNEESQQYFQYLCQALAHLSETQEPLSLCLQFEMGLLDMLGYKPELSRCVTCRQALSDYSLGAFHQEWGGIVCHSCHETSRTSAVHERWQASDEQAYAMRLSTQITPLVWKQLVLAADLQSRTSVSSTPALKLSLEAAQRLIQNYIEHRAGKKMKSLDFVHHLSQ